jgi:hypothetical protein
VARSNLTIMDLSGLSPPERRKVTDEDVSSYTSALSWLLDYSAAGIPSPSSPIELFWSNSPSLNDTFVDGVLLQSFRSILAFPVWFFNANNYGNANLSAKILNPNLPEGFYTKAAIVSPHVKLKFDSVLLIVFVALEGVVLFFLWGGLLWIRLPRSSDENFTISSFPIFDFLFKAWISTTPRACGDGSKKGKSSEILKEAENITIYASGTLRDGGGRLV